MPIWEPSLAARRSRRRPTSRRRSTTSCRRRSTPTSCCTSGPFADVIPIPFPIIQNVASIGDVFLTLGLAFFLFAAVVRVPQELEEASSRASGRASTTWPRPRPPAARRTTGRRDRPVAGPDRAGRAGAAAGDGQRRRRAWPRRRCPRVRGSTQRTARRRHGPDPAAIARDRRARPPAPIRPARAQRLVLGAVGRPAHLALRRPAQPARARRGGGDRDRLRARDRARLLRGHAAEPAAEPDRGHVRRPLGPQGGDGRQRHPPRGASSCSCRSPR